MMNKLEIAKELIKLIHALYDDFEKEQKEREKLENLIKEQEQVIAVLRNRLELKDHE